MFFCHPTLSGDVGQKRLQVISRKMASDAASLDLNSFMANLSTAAEICQELRQSLLIENWEPHAMGAYIDKKIGGKSSKGASRGPPAAANTSAIKRVGPEQPTGKGLAKRARRNTMEVAGPVGEGAGEDIVADADAPKEPEELVVDNGREVAGRKIQQEERDVVDDAQVEQVVEKGDAEVANVEPLREARGEPEKPAVADEEGGEGAELDTVQDRVVDKQGDGQEQVIEQQVSAEPANGVELVVVTPVMEGLKRSLPAEVPVVAAAWGADNGGSSAEAQVPPEKVLRPKKM